MEQLGILAEQTGTGFLPIVKGQTAIQIAKRAMDEGKKGGYDVVFLDTAGRTTINDELMDEVAAIAEETKPIETLLVADALTGQDAVETAKRFHVRLPLTGLVLTRIDGDGRGGAALSMRAVTGLPIKFLGTGEKLDGLEAFDAERLAGRILGQGDIVSLVEKASQVIDEKEAEKMAKKMEKGTFDLDDLGKQMGGLMKMMPGMGKMKKQLDAAGGIDDRLLKQQQAIILSMTPQERKKPELLKASRKKRIAAGSGMSVQEVNKLLKMHRQMSDMMKKMGKPVIMGRITWESLPFPLPGRDNLVLTRNPNYKADGAEVFTDKDDILKRAYEIAQSKGVDEVMVIGGGQIYKLFLPDCDKVYITRIEADLDGDTYFPIFKHGKHWDLVENEPRKKRPKDEFPSERRVYERKMTLFECAS